ncbi:MAG: outer membrane protein [Magnetospirillum sp.]
MSIKGFIIVLGIMFVPALGWAQDKTPPAPKVDPKKGWYFSGKGGPSFENLSGVSAAQSGATATEDASEAVVGAFGMAGGYEWMYRYHVPLRTELEFINRTEIGYDASPLMQGGTGTALASTVQNVTTMAKAYWHFPVNSDKWWPFVSGGLGWSHNTIKSRYTPNGGAMTKTTNTVDDLAWSVGAGATFKLGPDVMNDVEIRYVDLGKVDWGLPAGQNIQTNAMGDYTATEISFAIRYMF